MPLTEPVFTSAVFERSYNPGVDEEYWDVFYYDFELELHDADPAKPITAKLQYADPGSGAWSDCPANGKSVLTASYSGAGETWACSELSFDVFYLDLGDEIGMMKQVRIAVDYTLTDGRAGTVYSTDCGSLFAYTGEYILPLSIRYEEDTVTAACRIDTDLIRDLNGLTLQQLTLFSSSPYAYEAREIENDAVITPFAEDGSFTVTYDMGGEVLYPDKANGLIVVYSYEDYDGLVLWDSTCILDIEMDDSFTAPTLESAGVTPDTAAGFSRAVFTAAVNDGARYGDLTASLRLWNGSGYEDFTGGPAAVGTISLPRGDSRSLWDAGPAADACLIADLAGDKGCGIVQILLGYTDTGGQRQEIGSEPMAVYEGSFVTPVENGSKYVGDLFFEASFLVDRSLVDPALVQRLGFTVTDSRGRSLLGETEEFTLDPETGALFIRGELSDFPAEDAEESFTVTVQLLYVDESGPARLAWPGTASVSIPLTDDTEYLPPELTSAEIVTGSPVYLPFAIQMNDAELVSASLFESPDPGTEGFSPSSSASGTVYLYHDNLADPVETWVTTPAGECLSGSVALTGGLPGAIRWFRAEFDYTLPNDAGSFLSEAYPVWVGSFFEPMPGQAADYYPAENRLTASWAIYRELAPKPETVRVISVRLLPDSPSLDAIVLPKDCVSIDGSGTERYYTAALSAAGLAPEPGAEYALELTMNVSDGAVSWTAVRTVRVAVSG